MNTAITLDSLAADLYPETLAHIRASVARSYRAARRYVSPTMAANEQVKGFAQQLANEWVASGAVDSISGYYYLVAMEYHDAAGRLLARRTARRRLARAS